MTESSVRSILIVVLSLGCVAGMVYTNDADVRQHLIGALLVLIPASLDATRVALRSARRRRESSRPPPAPVVVQVQREDTARTRGRRDTR